MKNTISIVLAAFMFLGFCLSASAQTKSSDLSTNTALQLAVKANEHYWSMMSGHILSSQKPVCDLQTFTFNKTEYRYLCSELGTKKKFFAYMHQVFTGNAIEKAMDKYKIIENKGRLAQPNADAGSLLEWNHAKVRLLYKRTGVRLFEFSIPYGENSDRKVEKRKITFVYVGNRWLINSVNQIG